MGGAIWGRAAWREGGHAGTSQAHGSGSSQLIVISGSYHAALYATWSWSRIILLLHGSILRHYGAICRSAHADLGSLCENYGRRPLFMTTTTITFSRIVMGLIVAVLTIFFLIKFAIVAQIALMSQSAPPRRLQQHECRYLQSYPHHPDSG